MPAKNAKIMSQPELDFIANNKDIMTVKQMAAHLGRSVPCIRTHLNTINAVHKVQSAEVENAYVEQLRAMPFWPAIRATLIEREIAYFESQWTSFIDQFSGSIEAQATDYMMIKDIILFDILFLRALAERTTAITLKKSVEDRIDRQMLISPELRDMVALKNDQAMAASLAQGIIRFTNEANDFQQRKEAQMKYLRGTREQRFKQIEESRSDIFECIKQFDEKKKRIKEGQTMAKMKLAAEKIREDWAATTTFNDGSQDSVYIAPEDYEDKVQNTLMIEKEVKNE